MGSWKALPRVTSCVSAFRAQPRSILSVRSHWSNRHLPQISFRRTSTMAPLTVPLVPMHISNGVASNFSSWFSQFFSRYRVVARAYPLRTSFTLCFATGCLANLFVQSAVEHCQKLDWRRVFAVALFSGAFTGCAYHGIFNIAFPFIFGSSKALPTVFSQVVVDAAIVFPFAYMPSFELSNALIRTGSISGVFSRWLDNVGSAVNEYMKIWPVATICIFTVVPVELRVLFLAGVSFVWLVILSLLSR